MVRDNCAHSHLIFDLLTFLCFMRVSEGHFLCRVIKRNGNYIILSRVKSFDCVAAYF